MRKMRKLKHPNLIASLVGIIATVALINPLLWLVDPLGLLTYLDDLETLWTNRTPTHEGYSIADGIYNMRGYTATIEGGKRIMPMVEGATCTIAFVGDSVTFAMGVEDDENFAWQIAEAFPDIQFVNEGMPAYNAENNRRVIEGSNADGFILIHIHNDDQALDLFDLEFSRDGNALYWYQRYLQQGFGGDYVHDATAYRKAMAVISAYDNVLTVAFEGDELLNDDSVDRIPLWTSNVSAADGHPDANGHDEITANLLPIVEPFVDITCS